MARMPISGTMIESVVEAGSALATGAGLHYAYVGPVSSGASTVKDALNRTLLVDLAVGIIGTVGATQLRGTISNISGGVAMGALGHLGAMLVQRQMLYGTQGAVGSYSPSYRTGSYIGGYSSMPVLEI